MLIKANNVVVSCHLNLVISFQASRSQTKLTLVLKNMPEIQFHDQSGASKARE